MIVVVMVFVTQEQDLVIVILNSLDLIVEKKDVLIIVMVEELV
jgi:hypothetical protein